MYFLECLDIITITFLLRYGMNRCQEETDGLACFLSPADVLYERSDACSGVFL